MFLIKPHNYFSSAIMIKLKKAHSENKLQLRMNHTKPIYSAIEWFTRNI
jgi:hypothetical protein